MQSCQKKKGKISQADEDTKEAWKRVVLEEDTYVSFTNLSQGKCGSQNRERNTQWSPSWISLGNLGCRHAHDCVKVYARSPRRCELVT